MKKILIFLIFISFNKANSFQVPSNINAAIQYLNNGNDVNDEIAISGLSIPLPPLFFALYNNYIDMAELYIMRGADLNWRRSKGKLNIFDAFFCICVLSEDQILLLLELLIRHKADINMQGKFNRTLLINAVINKQEKVAKLLLETKKADIDIKDDNGYSALDYIESDEMLQNFKNYISDEKYAEVYQKIQEKNSKCEIM